MGREVHDTHEWLWGSKDLPPEHKKLVVDFVLNVVRERISNLRGKPVIGIDDRVPGLIVYAGVTDSGQFRFTIPLEQILNSTVRGTTN